MLFFFFLGYNGSIPTGQVLNSLSFSHAKQYSNHPYFISYSLGQQLCPEAVLISFTIVL